MRRIWAVISMVLTVSMVGVIVMILSLALPEQQLTPKQACEDLGAMEISEQKMSCYGDSKLAQKMCDEREWTYSSCAVPAKTCGEIGGTYISTSGCNLPPHVRLEQRDTDIFLATTEYGVCEAYLEVCVVENSVHDFRMENPGIR